MQILKHIACIALLANSYVIEQSQRNRHTLQYCVISPTQCVVYWLVSWLVGWNLSRSKELGR